MYVALPEHHQETDALRISIGPELKAASGPPGNNVDSLHSCFHSCREKDEVCSLPVMLSKSRKVSELISKYFDNKIKIDSMLSQHQMR